MKFHRMFAAILCICCAAAIAHAQHDDDVILAVQNAKVVTGVMHDGRFEVNRLWILDIDGGITADPGYDAPTGTFPASATVGIAIRKALRFWDYENSHFNNIADETVVITRFALSAESPPSDPCPGLEPSLSLGLASASGSLHVHPWYQVTAPASDGMYLLELEFWVNTGLGPAIASSSPFWVIFTMNENNQKAILNAEEWVATNMINVPLPCPADLTGNSSVGVADLLALLAAWGPNPCHPADLNQDGQVGVADLLILLGEWGQCK